MTHTVDILFEALETPRIDRVYTRRSSEFKHDDKSLQENTLWVKLGVPEIRQKEEFLSTSRSKLTHLLKFPSAKCVAERFA